MSEDKAREIKARITTIRNMAATAESREICSLLMELVDQLGQPDEAEECGFTGNSKVKAAKTVKD